MPKPIAKSTAAPTPTAASVTKTTIKPNAAKPATVTKPVAAKTSAKPAAKPAAKKSSKVKTINTDTVTVKWGHTHKPDMAFKSCAYRISVILTEELLDQLQTVCDAMGGSKVNGIKNHTDEDSGETYTVVSFKNKSMAESGEPFVCYDSKAKPTKAHAFSGDKVRLRLYPFMVEDGSISFALSGVQIVEKNSTDSGFSGGFGEVDGGFVGDGEGPVSDGDIPGVSDDDDVDDDENEYLDAADDESPLG